MSGSISIKFATISEERRDAYVEYMIAVLDNLIKGADVVDIVYTDETPTMRGKAKYTKSVKWEAGQDAPTFEELGIHSTQRNMFEPMPSHRTFTAPLGSGLPDHGSAIAEAEADDAPAEQLDEQPVGLAPTEDEAQPLHDDNPSPTVEETREALGPWAYLLDTPTDQDADQLTDEETTEERSHEQDERSHEQQHDDQQASDEQHDDQSQAE